MSDDRGSLMARGLRTSAWLFYCLIVFEILFMVSPFALYYYSVYAVPLNWLQQSRHAAWVTLHILPHFTYTDSLLSNGLLIVSWPLILGGLILFFWGFGQIYWSQLNRKGNVAGGLYRLIRHPQYLALAIVGLGTTIYWSRFIVLAAYVTMLFLYYFLARYEERICIAKFGEAYRDYQQRTGMFLPKAWLEWLPRAGGLLPEGRAKRAIVLALLFLTLLAGTVELGWELKHHVVDRLTVHAEGDLVLVALAPTSPETLAQIASILQEDEAVRAEGEKGWPAPVLGYVAPASWSVPELGLRSATGHQHAGLAELMHPTIHGNSLEFDPDRVTVLLTEPVLINPETRGRAILLQTLRYLPRWKAELDLARGVVTRASDEPEASRWQGIPVPVY